MVGVSLHQPNYLPWTKLLAKIQASDVYIAYDTVQFTRSEYHNRQRLRCRGETVLLSVPVRRAKSRQAICDVELDNSRDWRGYHLRIIEQEYRRTPYFSEVFGLLQEVYGRQHHSLADLNLDLIDALCGYLGYTTTIVRASQFTHAGDNTERLIQLTRAVGADEHLTSTWGTEREYIDWCRVTAAGITVRSQDFRHPVYRQQHDPFFPDLSVVDLLFAHGAAAAASMIAQSTRFPAVSA